MLIQLIVPVLTINFKYIIVSKNITERVGGGEIFLGIFYFLGRSDRRSIRLSKDYLGVQLYQ